MDVKGKKVTVVGLGATAISLVRLLLRHGAHPFVTEIRPAEQLGPLCNQLDELGVPYECGGHTDAAFRGAALVIPSPGAPPGIEHIRRAAAAGTAVLGEMEFAFPHCRPRILAVTGTNGKTTTTELLRVLVETCGHSVLLAGNNAFPFSEAAMVEPPPEFVVAEVSSYQLETAHTFRPWIGVVLNVTSDHLERHGDLDAYAAVKARMFANQQPCDFAVVNHDDPRVRGMAAGGRATVRPFSLTTRLESGLWLNDGEICLGDAPLARASDTRLLGRHNLQNVLAALSVIRAGGFDWDRAIEGLRLFRGVEHRIEHVAEMDGVAFYNDSKSTNIDSLKMALQSFDAPIVLIAGGKGKGSDYRVLRDLVEQRVRGLVAIGLDGPKLVGAFGDLVSAESASDMEDAVRRAAMAAAPGDVVLLSPACASFDMYDNFEHRGRVFKDCVRKLVARRTGALSDQASDRRTRNLDEPNNDRQREQ